MEKASSERDLLMEQGPCKGISLWKRLFAKEFPFGVGSLQRDLFMDSRLDKYVVIS